MHDGVQPVGDDQQGASGGQARQGFLDGSLALGIGSGRGLVQHQHGRVQQHGARNAQALLFAPGQLGVFADHRVIAARQRQDAFMDVGGARRLLHLLRAGRGPAQCDVLAHAGMHQAHVLQHKGQVAVQLCGLDLPQVHPAQRDAPLVRVEEAQQQPGERGLARARGTDHGGHRAGPEREIHALENVMPRLVGMAHAFEADFAALGQPALMGGRLLQHGRAQQRLHALGGARGVVERMQVEAEQLQRRADARRHQGKGQHVHGRHPAQGREQRAKGQHHPQHGHGRDQRIGIGARRHQRTRKAEEGVGKAIDGLAVAAMGAPAGAKGLDHGNAVHELHHRVVDARQSRAKGRHVGTAGLHGVAHHQKEDAERQGRDQGHAPVHGHQVDRRSGHRARAAPHRGVEVRGQLVQGGHVVLHGLLDLARGPLGEPAQRHTRQPLHGRQAQPVGEAVVGQMGNQLARRHQGHAREQADKAQRDDAPGICRHHAAIGQRQPRDMGDAGQRRQRQHGARKRQQRGKNKLRADGLQRLRNGAGAGLGVIGLG